MPVSVSRPLSIFNQQTSFPQTGQAEDLRNKLARNVTNTIEPPAKHHTVVHVYQSLKLSETATWPENST